MQPAPLHKAPSRDHAEGVEYLRFALPHLLTGAAAGIVCAVALVATNVASLRDLMWHTQGGWIAFLMLVAGCVITFGAIAIGGAIMALAEDD